MKPFRMTFPMLALLAAACAPAETPTRPPERPSVIIGMPNRNGVAMIDSVYWYMGIRPDTVMAQNGMLRVVVPGNAFERRVVFTATGCYVGPVPPLGALRSVALHAWTARDSSIRSDTVQVVIPIISDTLRHRSWLGGTAKSCGSGTVSALIDAAKLATTNARGTPAVN